MHAEVYEYMDKEKRKRYGYKIWEDKNKEKLIYSDNSFSSSKDAESSMNSAVSWINSDY